MKYIKVGSMIRKVIGENGDLFIFKSHQKGTLFLIDKKDVDKQDDCIVELFDRIILITAPSISEGVWRAIYSDKLTAVAVFKDDQRKDKFSRDFSRCMGAVWADDGLKYVAEYKDGMWELL